VASAGAHYLQSGLWKIFPVKLAKEIRIVFTLSPIDPVMPDLSIEASP
jgi:hypothetical protein